MPAGFTHILLTKTFTENAGFTDFDAELVNILQLAQDYFQVGALGPDLPYSQMINPLSDDEKIADKFHYINTTDVPLRGLAVVKNMPDGELKDKAFAFFLGYLGHIVADGTIHPFIRDKVGDYEQNKDAHRLLEMRLDVLFLDHLSKNTGLTLNLNTSQLQDEIENVYRDFEPIACIFSDVINITYNENTNSNQIRLWVKTLKTMFELASNENNQYYAFIPKSSGFLYKDSKQLLANKDKDLILKNNEASGRSTNYRNQETHFFNDCIPNFYKKFKPIAIAAFKYVYKNGIELSENTLPAINLDTGRSIANNLDGKNLDNPAEYWG